MDGKQWKEIIEKIVVDYVKEYQKQHELAGLWRTPLVGYADADGDYVQSLSRIVAEVHRRPQDFMDNPTVVISYFIPFTPELARTNVGVEDNRASREWADAYKVTNAMMADLNEHLAAEIIKRGQEAAVPSDAGMITGILKSRWSQRHLAYAAGLGTFGINNMLISREGCCGRYNSIVADIPVEPSGPQEAENCLYRSRGICGKCVRNCFSGALTKEGFDRQRCYEACEKNREIFGVDVCGKCDTDIPCAFTAPKIKGE